MDRLLVIVAREEPERYANLKRLFADETVEVIVDRRVGRRRQRHTSPVVDRRRGDRRARVRSEFRMPLGRGADVVSARQRGRELAAAVGLSSMDSTVVATAVSELAQNVVSHAVLGEVTLSVIENKHALGIEAVATDSGPGILDIARALSDADVMSGGVRAGLAGVRRVMDAFFITSTLGKGTAITIRKWRRG